MDSKVLKIKSILGHEPLITSRNFYNVERQQMTMVSRM